VPYIKFKVNLKGGGKVDESILSRVWGLLLLLLLLGIIKVYILYIMGILCTCLWGTCSFYRPVSEKKNERRVSYLKVSLYIGQRKFYIITFTQPIIEYYRLYIIIFYLSIF